MVAAKLRARLVQTAVDEVAPINSFVFTVKLGLRRLEYFFSSSTGFC